MWLLKARDFSFVLVFVLSNWYFYKPLFQSLSFPELADDKSQSSVVEQASERERERERGVSFVDLLTIKSINQLTWSLEKQWVISKLYVSMTDDDLIPENPQVT